MISKSINILVGYNEDEYPACRAFEKLGKCTFHRYDRDYLENNIDRFDIIIPHLFIYLNEKYICKAERLKLVATPSTGTDHIEIDALTRKGIALISLNDDRSFIDQITSTAEMTWLLILSCCRKIRLLQERVYRDRSWDNVDIRGYQLFGKTIGVIGYGRLGKMVASYAHSFKMRVMAFDTDSSVFKDDSVALSVDLNTLITESDVISLHAKLNNSSKYIIDKATISKMKRGVILVNTARGELINPVDAVEGMRSGIIDAIGIDVCNNEYQSTKLPKDPILIESMHDKRIIVTPHVGGATHDAHEIVFGKISELIDIYINKQ